MSEIALSKIAGLIKVEDDLAKVASLRLQFVKEKASVDVKLSSTTQTQIDSIMNNLSKLNTAAVKLNAIKGNISKVNQVHDDSITKVKDYSTIRAMTNVNQFLNQVSNLYDDISNFQRYLRELNSLMDIEIDRMKSSLTYPLTKIFEIHYSLNQARNFADYLEYDSLLLSNDLESIVLRIIKPVKESIRKFDELLSEAITSLTESVKEGNVALAFKVVKIVEFEHNEDLKFTLIGSLGLRKAKDTKTTNYSTFRNTRRNYKQFFHDKLEELLVENFNQCVNYYANNKMQVFDSLDWLEDELLFVNEKFDFLFPTEWEIGKFIQNVYYNQLHKFALGIIKTDPPAEDLLRILSYDSHYSKFISALNDTKKEQRSIIGEDMKNVVLEDYLKVILGKMDEWNKNLILSETSTFKLRSSPPESYSYHQVFEDVDERDLTVMMELDANVLVLPDFKTSLAMLKEQADVAADSGYSKILVGVIENWSRGYNARIENYRNLIEEDFETYMVCFNKEKFLVYQNAMKRLFKKGNVEQLDIDNMTVQELESIAKPGLIEYLAALGNTYEINTDRLQDKFLENYKEKVHPSYHVRLEKAFEDTLSPSTELISQIVRYIVDIIVNDLYPALSNTFNKTWYEAKSPDSKNPPEINQIVQTIFEYMSEIRAYTSYDIYQVTFNILLDTFVSAYLKIGYSNILKGGASKIDPKAVKKYKSFSAAVSRDAGAFFEAFKDLVTAKDTEYLFKSLSAIEYLADLATCEDPLQFIPQLWENEILPTFYFCSVEYVRGLCLCRKDMDKAQINGLVSELLVIQRRYQSEHELPPMPVSTLNDFDYK